MSPTTKCIAVYIWLKLIDNRLPQYISCVYAHDLQLKSLKDLQPQEKIWTHYCKILINKRKSVLNIHPHKNI